MLASLDRAGIQMRVEGAKLLDERIGFIHEFANDVDGDGICGNLDNCTDNGVCDPYNEGCVCADCADNHPACIP